MPLTEAEEQELKLLLDAAKPKAKPKPKEKAPSAPAAAPEKRDSVPGKFPGNGRSLAENIWIEMTSGRPGTTPENSPTPNNNMLSDAFVLSPMALGAGVTAEGGNLLQSAVRGAQGLYNAGKGIAKAGAIVGGTYAGLDALKRRLFGR